MDKKKKIGIFIIILMIGAVFLSNQEEEIIVETPSGFLHKYFNVIKSGDMNELDKSTSDITLYNKIGNFHKNTCNLSIEQDEIIRKFNNIKAEVDALVDKTAEEKMTIFNSKMMTACGTLGAYDNYDLFFTKLNIVKSDEVNKKYKVVFDSFSKLLMTNIRMEAVMIKKDNSFEMEKIDFFPEASDFFN